MNLVQQLQSYLPIITTTVIIIGWFIRLETKTMTNEKEIDKIQVRNAAKDSESDAQILKILVKLEGLETTNKFILEALTDLKRK